MANASSPTLNDSAADDVHSYAGRNTLHWKRNLAVCVFGSFTTLVSLTLLLPFLPIYVEELGIKDSASIVQWSGLAFGATFLATGLTAPLWGHLSDRYGRKPMLIRAALGMAAVMPLIGLAHNVYQLTLLRFVAGLIGGYASSSTLLVATQTPRDRAGWALGILSTGALAGTMIGPLVGGILPKFIGIRHTFFFSGGMIAVAALATIFLVKENFVRKPVTAIPKQPVTLASLGPAAIVVAAMFCTAMLVLFANMSIEPIITVYLGVLNVSRESVVLDAGMVMAASAFGSILMAARLGRLADRIGGWKVIIYCLAATCVVLIPQAFVTSWWQLAALRFVMGMTLAGLLPAIAKVIRQTVPEAALGKVLGYSQSAQYAGQVLGPLAGGAVGGLIGMRSVLLVTSVLLLTGAGLNLWARHHVSRMQLRGQA
ncbi:MFS transporter [Undibacterium sp.]|uniref:MFS transporter n=1 Tax=Undibacterium sp. TaxID=1914977 RepID=UPI00374DAE62